MWIGGCGRFQMFGASFSIDLGRVYPTPPLLSKHKNTLYIIAEKAVLILLTVTNKGTFLKRWWMCLTFFLYVGHFKA